MKQSVLFNSNVYITEGATVAGSKEKDGPLSDKFDIVTDDYAGQENWEAAESKLIEMAIDKLLIKCNLKSEGINYLFGGDLLGQLMATSFAVEKFQIPLFGLYGACSTLGEALSLGAMCVSAGYAKRVISMTSSHFASAEKQFRFPLDYGSQRPLSSSWTVTGSGAYLLTDKPKECGPSIKITGITTGKIVDFGVKDSMNMGACMAPAAAQVIEANLKDFDIPIDYYDKVFTGDLGIFGKKILGDFLKEEGIASDRLMDCGIEIYGEDEKCAGGSGCGCSALVLNTLIIPRLLSGEYKRVLFIPTGALLSSVSFNEGKSVPGIAHAVMLEREER